LCVNVHILGSCRYKGTRGSSRRERKQGKALELRNNTTDVLWFFSSCNLSVISRAIQVPSALQERPALLGHRVHQENQELKVWEGCLDQWY